MEPAVGGKEFLMVEPKVVNHKERREEQHKRDGGGF
jgi:hypothetical protein